MPAFQPDANNVSWRVSQQCDGGACVAVGGWRQSILVGDIKQPGGPFVTYTAGAWEKFLGRVKKGDFDRPL